MQPVNDHTLAELVITRGNKHCCQHDECQTPGTVRALGEQTHQLSDHRESAKDDLAVVFPGGVRVVGHCDRANDQSTDHHWGDDLEKIHPHMRCVCQRAHWETQTTIGTKVTKGASAGKQTSIVMLGDNKVKILSYAKTFFRTGKLEFHMSGEIVAKLTWNGKVFEVNSLSEWGTNSPNFQATMWMVCIELARKSVIHDIEADRRKIRLAKELEAHHQKLAKNPPTVIDGYIGAVVIGGMIYLVYWLLKYRAEEARVNARIAEAHAEEARIDEERAREARALEARALEARIAEAHAEEARANESRVAVPPEPEPEPQECIICMVQSPNTVFLPCGHGGVCEGCANKLLTNAGGHSFPCPRCRRPVRSIHRVYI